MSLRGASSVLTPKPGSRALFERLKLLHASDQAVVLVTASGST